MRVGFTTGKAIMTAEEGNEYFYKYDAINDNGTIYVNLDSSDPYTATVSAYWYDQYAAANPARARTLARLVKRMNKLTVENMTAKGLAVEQITGTGKSSYALLPRTQMSVEALKMTSSDLLASLGGDKALARSVAKEQPSLIRRALDITGDITTEERAKKLMQQAEANLLYALCSSAENNTTPEGRKISTVKKKPLPNGMRAIASSERFGKPVCCLKLYITYHICVNTNISCGLSRISYRQWRYIIEFMGGQIQMAKKVTVLPYDETWKAAFEKIKE